MPLPLTDYALLLTHQNWVTNFFLKVQKFPPFSRFTADNPAPLPQVNFAPMITHRYDFDRPGDVLRAFECTLRRRDEAGNPSIKVFTSASPSCPNGHVV